MADITRYNPALVQQLIEQEQIEQSRKVQDETQEPKPDLSSRLGIKKTKPNEFTIKLVNKQADISGLAQIHNVLINSPIKLIPNTQVMQLRKPETHVRLNSVDVQA